MAGHSKNQHSSQRGYKPYKQLRLFSWRKDRWVYTPTSHAPRPRGLAARPDAVPAQPIIQAFYDSGVSLSHVNRQMYGNSHTLTNQRLRSQQYFLPDTAIRFIRAIGLDPVDFDL